MDSRSLAKFLLGVGLAFAGIEFGKCLRADLSGCRQSETCADQSLRAFFDLNVNREVVLSAVVVVVDFGLNLDLAESVGHV